MKLNKASKKSAGKLYSSTVECSVWKGGGGCNFFKLISLHSKDHPLYLKQFFASMRRSRRFAALVARLIIQDLEWIFIFFFFSLISRLVKENWMMQDRGLVRSQHSYSLTKWYLSWISLVVCLALWIKLLGKLLGTDIQVLDDLSHLFLFLG